MQPDTFSDIPLATGESLHLPVDAGAVLLVAQGCVRIEESPRWLAGRMVSDGRTVEEGQPYTVQQSGWIRVTALGGTGVRLRSLPAVAPAWRVAPWWHFVRQWLSA